MEYLTTVEMSAKWNITSRRIGVLCAEGRVAGAVKKGKTWLIPLMQLSQQTEGTRKILTNNYEEVLSMILNKKQMTEEDIKLNYITPAVQKKWYQHITMETQITDGKINIRGNMVARSKPQRVDYMLYMNDSNPIAVIEAKDNNHSISHGLQQAIEYAKKLDLPFAYSSNGDGFYEHDFLTGVERQISRHSLNLVAEM